MILSTDLIATARELAQLHERRPRQSDLRHSISSAHYVLFHGLAEITADRLAGATPIARQTRAWRRIYRDLSHSEAKKARRVAGQSDSPAELLMFASAFIDLQELRHQGDRDTAAPFKHCFVVDRVDEAEQALTALQCVAKEEQLDFITLALGMTRS